MPKSKKEKEAKKAREKALRDVAKELIYYIANYILGFTC
jgi:hypothetical protein